MAKTKKKEVQKQGLRPSQKAKAEKLRQKQEAKTMGKTESKKDSATIKEEVTVEAKVVTTPVKTSTPKKLTGKTIHVKNAEGDPDTVAEIIIQNKIDYIPKVSVIIPVYNVEPYLRQCLDSVINQTLKEIEIICVDDGSTDASLDILKEYAAKDKRITVITQKNLYAGVARNAGLSQAKGEYVHFLDSDDWIEKEIYSYSIKEMDKSKASVYLFNFNDFDMVSEQVVLHTPYQLYKKTFYFCDNTSLLRRPVVPWNKLYRRAFIEQNQIKYDATIVANDRTFYFKMLFANPVIMKTSSEVAFLNYRINNSKSLVGVKRLRNFNSHFISFERSLEVCRQKYPDCAEDIVDLFIQDCFYFYKKADSEQKLMLDEILHKYFIARQDLLSCCNSRNYKWNEFYKTILHKDNIIPIVFATNDLYAKFVPVTIYSIIKNANKNDYYAFYVFHSGLGEEAIKTINSIYNSIDGSYDVNFINVKQSVGNSLYSRGRFSIEMWYRVFIPELLPQYQKVLYLDCDLIACKNVAELYKKDLGDSYLGVCKNYITESHKRLKNLDLNPDMYFNSGVLLFNNTKWNDLGLRNKCLEMAALHPDLECPDQDVLNMVCKNHAKFLETKWNFTWQFLFSSIKLSGKDLKEYDDAQNDLAIIHYTSAIKPWNSPNYKYANLWWEYAIPTKLFTYKTFLEQWYKKVTKKELNLDNPKTFNEKIQWLKLYDSTPIKTRLADKYLVREWVKEKIGEQYLIPILGVYDKFEDINFDKLPEQFVIKCNHSSGWNIIVKNKSDLDLTDAKEKLDKWMATDFAVKAGCELHYKNIPHKIVIEKYVTNDNQNLYDYKFWCFNGKVKYMQFRDDFSANLKMVFYDMNWKKQPFHYDHPLYNKKLEKPTNFAEMVEIAKKLCQGFAFVCVDLYRLNDGTIKFGEMTFTRSSGSGHWNEEKYNKQMGNLIKLPKMAYNLDTGEYYKYRFYKSNILKPYIYFPYNIIKLYQLRKKYLCTQKNILTNSLTKNRIDIRNCGDIRNSIIVKSDDSTIEFPEWLRNSKGIGCLVTGRTLKQKVHITAVKDGILEFEFKSPNKIIEGEKCPIWIDYKSIKINEKEIISIPVETWHDKPYRYKMPVEDKQEVELEVEQQYHEYTENELKTKLIKLNPNNEYLKKEFSSILASIKKTWPIIDENTHHKKLLDNCISDAISTITKNRIDIRNCGDDNNSIIVKSDDSTIEFPEWLRNSKSIGCLVSGKALKQKINIIAVKDGILEFEFKSPNKIIEGEKCPIWIDYKSIKINGKELLSTPVETWHDKPYRYKMPVEDKQEVELEVEQRYHEYTENELKNLLLRLNPNFEHSEEFLDYYKKNIGFKEIEYTWDYVRNNILSQNPQSINVNDIAKNTFGRLQISVENTKFESILLPSKIKKLYVFLSGYNVGDNYPQFSRISWCNQFVGYRLFMDDPTRFEKKFSPSYFFGDKNHNYLEYVKQIIKKIALCNGIKNESIIFIASSNCGFSSLYLADCIQGSKCIALNPQIDLRLHCGEDFGKVMDIDINDPIYFDRLNVMRILENKVSQFFICFNISCNFDKMQADLIFEHKQLPMGLSDLGFNVKVLCMDINAKLPHMVQPDEYFCSIIETFMDKPITPEMKELCNAFIGEMKRYYSQNMELTTLKEHLNGK